MRVPRQLWCWAAHHHHHAHILTTLLLILFISTITQHVEGGGGSDLNHGSNHGASITWNATAMFVFGDSLEDTGNGLFCSKPRAFELPFGITFPGHGDGRFCDGRILISDYLGTTTTTTTTYMYMYTCFLAHKTCIHIQSTTTTYIYVYVYMLSCSIFYRLS